MWSNGLEYRGRHCEERFAKGLSQLPEARIVREEVFVREQGFVNEFDDIDNSAWHCVIFSEGIPAATGRLYRDKERLYVGHIGRIAVIKQERGNGLGSLIIWKLEVLAREENFSELELSAQCRVQGFYAALGYAPEGGVYLDEGCPHIRMVKKLE